MKLRLLKKPPDLTIKTLSDAEEKQYTETIAKLQKELKGTDLKGALKLIEQNRLDEALALLSEKEIEEDEEIEKIARTRHAKAGVYKLKLDYKNALKYYEKAVQHAPDNSSYLNDAGLMLDTLAQYDKAIKYYEMSLASSLNNFSSDHPKVATYRNNLRATWKAKGNYDKAIEYYELALVSDLKSFSPDHPNVAIRRNNLGAAWKAKGDYDKAIEYFEKALASFEKANLPHRVKIVRGNISALKNQR